jgi:hypothetical protein
MWIGWGEQMSFLYNDAYLHVLGLAKHPSALGKPASEVWSEIWDVCGPLAEKVFRNGEPTFVDDVRLFMNRGELLEETYYSFSYSPIRNELGAIGGLFCPSNDVTLKVIGARRLHALSELSSNTLVEKTTEAACAAAAATLAKNCDDIPFALLYLIENNRAILKQTAGLSRPGELLAPNVVDLATETPASSTWPIAAIAHSHHARCVRIPHVDSVPRGPGISPFRAQSFFPLSRASMVRSWAYSLPLLARFVHSTPITGRFLNSLQTTSAPQFKMRAP